MAKTQKFQIINPNSFLRNFFEKNFGFRRWCWNQALEAWNKQKDLCLQARKQGNNSLKYPTSWNVRNQLKQNLPEWAEEYSVQILDCACDNLEEGFHSAFSKKKKDKPFQMKFKSKKDQRSKTFSYYKKNESSFFLKEENSKFYFSGPRMTLKKGGREKFWLQLSEKPKFKKEYIKTATIYFRDGKYFITIGYDYEPQSETNKPKRIVGCDWGAKTFLTCAFGAENQRSDALVFNGIRNKLKKLEKKISSIQSKRDKNCKKFSRRWKKLTKNTSKYYTKARNLRDNEIKQAVSKLTKRFGTIVIEDLDVSNITKRSHKNVKQKSALNQASLRHSFYAFKTHLQNKCNELGRILILADRWFPSTQICSHCRHRLSGNEKLQLSERTYVCPECGVIEGRDYNAAYNLKLYAHKQGWAAVR